MAKLTTKQEVTLLRSAVAGMVGRDKEGVYRPELVSEVFSGLSRSPSRDFNSPENFLEQVNDV